MGAGKSASVLDEILAWSDSLGELWVRDALRRVVTQPEMSDADIDDLADLCKKPHGLSEPKLQSAPLSAGHLPTGQNKGQVYLASLTHVSDVNALTPNETVTFGKTGLTIIYGDNGAGKSGYSRILKRACRARGSAEAILANALSDQPAGTPTAKVVVGVDGVETEHVWKDGAAAVGDLGAVSVFDSLAAQVYIRDKTEVRFRPFGLDVLDKLAGVCTRVKAQLDGEKTQLQLQTVAWPAIARDTEAGQLLANLTALTKPSEVDRLATMTDAEREELATLEDVLASSRLEDPTKKAADLRLKATRMRRLISELRTLSELYGAKSLGQLARLKEEAVGADGLADEAARAFSSEGLLAGLETQTWRDMWEASRAYSDAHAYPGRSFPHVGADARCVLCQQDVGPAARARMAKLEEFVRGKAQAEAKRKRKAADDAVKAYSSLLPGERIRDGLDDLASVDPAAYSKASVFLEEARTCRLCVLEGREPKPAESAVPIETLEKLANGLESRAAEMDRAADPFKRAESEKRLSGLQARSVFSGLRSQVLAEIERKGRINAYEQCVKDTSTNAATKLSGDLTKKHVTDALTKSFADELTKLGFTTLELELRTAGAQKGVQYHQVQFKFATRADLSKIVSEGEGRCVALAAFLAEVRCSAHASAIVFDDPVSSLDHRWRRNVARRLVEEAKTRQVIVFTHELVFLSTLLKEAERQEVPHEARTVRRGKDMLAGHVEQELPWDGLPTSKRIGVLRNMWQNAEKVHRTQEEKEYNEEAVRLYACLRQTWERALEEVLLGDVVQRFRQSIETQRLKGLDDIKAEDLKTVKDGMDKSSKWEGGHDHALAMNEPFPSPDEIKADIDALEQWVKAVRKRRQAAG